MKHNRDKQGLCTARLLENPLLRALRPLYSGQTTKNSHPHALSHVNLPTGIDLAALLIVLLGYPRPWQIPAYTDPFLPPGGVPPVVRPAGLHPALMIQRQNICADGFPINRPGADSKQCRPDRQAEPGVSSRRARYDAIPILRDNGVIPILLLAACAIQWSGALPIPMKKTTPFVRN
jgi:hypothetical protein